MYFPLFLPLRAETRESFYSPPTTLSSNLAVLCFALLTVILSSPRRLRAKYTPRTNLRFVLRVFLLGREARPETLLKRKTSEKNSGSFSSRANKNTLGKSPLTKSGNLDKNRRVRYKTIHDGLHSSSGTLQFYYLLLKNLATNSSEFKLF